MKKCYIINEMVERNAVYKKCFTCYLSKEDIKGKNFTWRIYNSNDIIDLLTEKILELQNNGYKIEFRNIWNI